ncbi:MAG: TIM barrel protein [Candidatus Omnitrophica bacterium]|nr:TIM barrel protein [Candidatus Omnitrophota bacterium]
MDNFAISTSWKSDLCSDIKRMLSEIRDAGFSAIEVSYNLVPERLLELSRLIGEFDIRVLSVHNFCPMPQERIKGRIAPCDYYRLSSLDEAERLKAIEYTKRSVDTAKSLRAKVLVVHAGTVELDRVFTGKLLELCKEGKANSKEYQIFKEEFLRIREAKKVPYLENTVKSLGEIVSYAENSGIKVGLEVRYYPNEIPNIEEAGYLLELFSSQGLVYWHDVGHAEVNEKLGITKHIEYLRRFKGNTGGIHIHDLRGIKDHLAPFCGEFDFSKILPYLKDERLIKVIEAHPPASSDEIKTAMYKLTVDKNRAVDINKSS